jgi:purine-cytosine permease-like protein
VIPRFRSHRSARVDILTGAYVGAILTEHLHFRKRNFANYDIQAWNVRSQLPLGAAALGASVMGFSLAIPVMNQVWFKGPFGKMFGDTSLIAAMMVTAPKYFFFRRFEKRRRGV